MLSLLSAIRHLVESTGPPPVSCPPTLRETALACNDGRAPACHCPQKIRHPQDKNQGISLACSNHSVSGGLTAEHAETAEKCWTRLTGLSGPSCHPVQIVASFLPLLPRITEALRRRVRPQSRVEEAGPVSVLVSLWLRFAGRGDCNHQGTKAPSRRSLRERAGMKTKPYKPLKRLPPESEALLIPTEFS